MVKFKKDDILHVIKALVFSLIISMILIMLYAVVLKLSEISDSTIEPINIVIRVFSILIGCLLGIKNRNGAIKGLLVAIMYLPITYLIFATLAKDFSNPFTFIDIIVVCITGILSGVIAVNIKSKREA